MYSRAVEDRVEDIERDLEQMTRIVQVMDEPTGSGGTDEVEEKMRELEVGVEGVEAGLDVVKMHMARIRVDMESLRGSIECSHKVQVSQMETFNNYVERLRRVERLQLLESTARAEAAATAAADAAGEARGRATRRPSNMTSPPRSEMRKVFLRTLLQR